MAVSNTHRVSPIPRPVKAPLRGACVDVSLDVVWHCPTRRSKRVARSYKQGQSDSSSSETLCSPFSSTRSPAATAVAELARGGGIVRVRVGVGPNIAWRGHASRRDQRSSEHAARRSRADVVAAFGDASCARRGTWGPVRLGTEVSGWVGSTRIAGTHLEYNVETDWNVSRGSLNQAVVSLRLRK